MIVQFRLLIIPGILAAMLLAFSGPDSLQIGSFSVLDHKKYELPPDWENMTFTGINRTSYELVEKDGRTVVQAASDNSASGLVREKEIDLAEFPIMRWTWRTDRLIEKGNVYEKSGDDYPARIYVMFDYDISNLSWGMRQRIRVLRTFYGSVPTRAINYIWDKETEIGTVVENPYTRLVQMVVVESGDENLGKWVSYERNVYQDYIDIFGEEPPTAGAIAIMTDSDDTGESALSWFGDITFHRE